MTTLFEPLTFRCGATVRNRVALAALTNKQSHEDGTLSENELRFLRMRAEGGFGIVMTCASHVAKEGQGWPGELGIFDDAHVPGLRRLADAVRAAGAAPLVQIFHGGLRADPVASGLPRWSASEDLADAGSPVHAATPERIERVIGEFGRAAERACEAGMTGVEIHGAHGYLITQFLSATENRRIDAWGGSLENRARLLRRVIREVRSRVPASFVVGVRISPEDWSNARGLDLDESLAVARFIAEEGADYVHLSLWDVSKHTQKRPEEHPIEAFRRVIPSEVRVYVAGHVWTRADADAALARGADGVALGRAAIANPDWALRSREPAWEPRRPPLTPEELNARGLSDGFVEYMRRWKEFVA